MPSNLENWDFTRENADHYAYPPGQPLIRSGHLSPLTCPSGEPPAAPRQDVVPAESGCPCEMWRESSGIDRAVCRSQTRKKTSDDGIEKFLR